MNKRKIIPGLDTDEPWIISASGRRLHPFSAVPDEIEIGDIARSLSRKCRFSGNLSDRYPDSIYTVAQHSVYVSSLVKFPRARLWGLLHDASEFPFGDMVSPVKSRFPDFKAAENAFAIPVRAKFNVPFDAEIEADVNWADLEMFFSEAEELTNMVGKHWVGQPAKRSMYDIDVDFRPWNPFEARTRFLAAFRALVS